MAKHREPLHPQLLTSSSIMSLQRSTHSSHMYTLGPAMSLRTSSWPLPQNVQDNLLASLFSISGWSAFKYFINYAIGLASLALRKLSLSASCSTFFSVFPACFGVKFH